MPTYKVTDPQTGVTLKLTGDSPPTDDELEQIFAEHSSPAPQKPQAPQNGIITSGGHSYGRAMPKEEQPGPDLTHRMTQGFKDFAGGSARGAGSIGATLLTPYDYAAGNTDSIGNPERRKAMDEGLRAMGVDTESIPFAAGKITTEVAGTAPIGGLIGKSVAPVAPRLGQAISSGGFSLGPNASNSALINALYRATGGAVSGGAMAGAVNPEDADMGAVIGGGLPVGAQLAGRAGNAIGANQLAKYKDALAKFNRGAPMRNTVKESVEAGYVIPPNMVKPSMTNRIIESMSGKQATSQLASVRNQETTEKLVRQALGIADDAPLTKGALEQMRKIEGGAYQKVGALSQDAATALESLKQARNDAQAWFNAYNRSASPEHLAQAKMYRDTAEALETQLEQFAANAGQSDLIPALRSARKQIAKTYTVERALNDGAGTVDARVIGRLFDKGKPLSDGLDKVGKFASTFPKIAQSSQSMGSPAAHNLRAVTSALSGGLGASTMGIPGLAAAVLPYAADATARGIMFNPVTQRNLANAAAPVTSRAAQKTMQLMELLKNLPPDMQRLLLAAPATSAAQ